LILRHLAENPGPQSYLEIATLLRSFIGKVKASLPDAVQIMAVMDGPTAGKERRKLFDEYKAKRKEDTRFKLFLAKALIIYAALGIECVHSTGGYETSDVIAALSKQALDSTDSTVAVVCADKGLLVLLANTRVELFRLSESGDVVEHTADAVRLKLGIDPHQVTDLLAIAGDKSIGIPGAEGIGEKGAAELLREYGSVDGLLSAVADGTIKKHSFTKAFIDPILKAKFDLSRNLVRLRFEATFEKMTIAAPVTAPPVLPPEDLDIDPRAYKLLKQSGIDDSYIAQMGRRYATASEVAEASAYPREKVCPDGAIAIPYPGVRKLDGSQYFSYRQLHGLPKYLGPSGQSTEIYVPIHYYKNKGSFALVITESEKKAALLDSIGIPALGIKGVSGWFDASSRAAQKERGEPLNEKTLPHKELLREVLDAEFVIILGDSDCHFNPLALHGLETLRQSLAYHVQLNHKRESAEPDWNPLKSTRNIPVSVALCNSRWENIQIEASQGKDGDCHAEPVKTGADDLFLRLLEAERERSATHDSHYNADNHSHDRVKAIHAMREL